MQSSSIKQRKSFVSISSSPSMNLPERPLLQRNRSDSAYSQSDTGGGAEEYVEATYTPHPSPTDICDEIGKLLEANPVGLNQEANYVPSKELKALLRIDSIQQGLGQPHNRRLAEYVRDKAQRTFATLLVVFRHSPKLRFQAMQAFKKAGFTDQMLSWETFAKCKDDCEAAVNTCHHYFPSPEPWGSIDLMSFDSARWKFLVPEFDHKIFQYDFHHQQILPWKYKVATISAGVGTFSEVTCIKMIAGHQSLLPTREDGTVFVAHKRLKPMDDVAGYNIDQEWRREAKAHSELNGRSNHLVQGVAAYQMINKETTYNTYHIVLEWADGGSLSSFCKANPAPQLSDNLEESRKRVRSLLEQVRGLTEALECMHFGSPSSRRSSVQIRQEDLPHSPPRPSNDEKAPPIISIQDIDEGTSSRAIPDEAETSDVPNADGLRLAVPHKALVRRNSFSDNWRHGDIKPDNILRFIGEDELAWLGTLKLADLGRAQLHQLNTAQRNTIERERWRTRWYEPPDLSADLHQLAGGKISRLFDIWSMGCVIFESVIWMLYGWSAIGEFQGGDSTDHEQFDTTPYWTKIAAGRYRVTHKAASWIEHVMHDTQKYSGALRDLIELVKDKLLIVNLPPDSEIYTPGYRTNARDMGLDLRSILEKAAGNSAYLFSVAGNYDVRPPSKEDANKIQLSLGKAPDLLSPVSARRQNKRPMAPQGQKPTPRPPQNFSTLQPPKSTILLPKPRASHATRIALDMIYTDDIDDEWQYLDDHDFAEEWIEQSEIPEEDELCLYCKTIDPMAEALVIRRSNIEENEGWCTLCELLSKATKNAGLGEKDEIRLVRILDTFIAREAGRTDVQTLRLCCVNDLNVSTSVPLGAPKLIEPGRVAKSTEPLIQLAKAWLDRSDDHHDSTCNTTRDRSQLPSRLLDVGPNRPKIIDSADLGPSAAGLRYIAFSHRWGEMPETAKTTKTNLSSRRKMILPKEIPASFADAIAITKALGCRYLWIDCLCINQGPDGDFAEQASSMQTVFSNAYCVLAAASAAGATAGFWARNLESHPAPVRKDDVFISAVTNDFTRDVLQSPLNQRGWVLQEHALARRTIFFTDNQMYWECGDGIRCETLRKMRHDVAGLLGDADFPSKTIQSQSTRGTQIHLWTRLFEQYSKLDFSYSEDRSVAIEGLIARLTTAFRTRSLYGVFESFWGRCLLWKRPRNSESLRRICPGEHAKKVPPTWSWMAVEGAIDFLEPEGGEVEWNNGVFLPFAKNTTEARSHNLLPEAQPQRLANSIANGTTKGEGIQTTAYSLTTSLQLLSQEVIHYDHEVQSADVRVKVVIICTSKNKKNHHVLLVSAEGQGKSYERIGVACLPEAYIDRTTAVKIAIE